MKTQLSRREFIAGASATAFAGAVAQGVHSEEASDTRAPGPNDRPRIAHIGCGSIGWHNANIVLNLNRADYVAVCDPDQSRVGDFVKKIGDRTKHKPDGYQDF